MGLAKSNAFPSLASNLVLGYVSLYEWNRASQTAEIRAGRGVDYGLLGSARNIPLAGSV
jgi:hypothetical protein